MDGMMNGVAEFLGIKDWAVPRRTGHVGAMMIMLECGLVSEVRKWLKHPAIQAAQENGDKIDCLAIFYAQAWLEWADGQEKKKGKGCLINKEHYMVKLFLAHSHVPDLTPKHV